MSTDNQVTVIVNGKEYQVEIKDITARPVIAVVNGKEIAVQIGQEIQQESKQPTEFQDVSKPSGSQAPSPQAPPIPNSGTIIAPLPGDVVEICVKSGDTVETGQVICVLEAMKMKNTVRSPRAGKIASVEIAVGQSVPHGAALVSFE